MASSIPGANQLWFKSLKPLEFVQQEGGFAHQTPKFSTSLHKHRRVVQPCKGLFRAKLWNSRNGLWKTQRLAESRKIPTRCSVYARGSYLHSHLQPPNLF